MDDPRNGVDQMRLPDGRTLAFSEWGSPDGPTAVLCHAGHVSRPITFGWEAAARVGMRLVCADRPGIGRSTFLSGRSIMDWPGDVAALMSHLGVDRLRLAEAANWAAAAGRLDRPVGLGERRVGHRLRRRRK